MKQHADMQRLILMLAAFGFAAGFMAAIPSLALLVEQIAGDMMSGVQEIVQWLEVHHNLATWLSAFGTCVAPVITYWAGGAEARVIKKNEAQRKSAHQQAFNSDLGMAIWYLKFIDKNLSADSISPETRAADAILKAKEGLSYLETSVARVLDYPDLGIMADRFKRGFRDLIDYAPGCTNDSGISLLRTRVKALCCDIKKYVEGHH